MILKSLNTDFLYWCYFGPSGHQPSRKYITAYKYYLHLLINSTALFPSSSSDVSQVNKQTRFVTAVLLAETDAVCFEKNRRHVWLKDYRTVD